MRSKGNLTTNKQPRSHRLSRKRTQGRTHYSLSLQLEEFRLISPTVACLATHLSGSHGKSTELNAAVVWSCSATPVSSSESPTSACRGGKEATPKEASVPEGRGCYCRHSRRRRKRDGQPARAGPATNSLSRQSLPPSLARSPRWAPLQEQTRGFRAKASQPPDGSPAEWPPLPGPRTVAVDAADATPGLHSPIGHSCGAASLTHTPSWCAPVQAVQPHARAGATTAATVAAKRGHIAGRGAEKERAGGCTPVRHESANEKK